METEFVLVETVSMFRIRYVIEVPKGEKNIALDIVAMDKPKEFSQKHLDEIIVSDRVLTREEVLKQCDEDNDYLETWSEDKKFENLVVTLDGVENAKADRV